MYALFNIFPVRRMTSARVKSLGPIGEDEGEWERHWELIHNGPPIVQCEPARFIKYKYFFWQEVLANSYVVSKIKIRSKIVILQHPATGHKIIYLAPCARVYSYTYCGQLVK